MHAFLLEVLTTISTTTVWGENEKKIKVVVRPDIHQVEERDPKITASACMYAYSIIMTGMSSPPFLCDWHLICPIQCSLISNSNHRP
jgi:hypothetical protein